jgi:hypothetical protein
MKVVKWKERTKGRKKKLRKKRECIYGTYPYYYLLLVIPRMAWGQT